MRTMVLLAALGALLWLRTAPARRGARLCAGGASGLGCLIVLNLLAPVTGMLFELNILTCALVGALGLPGIGLLTVAHYVLAH